MIYVLKLKHIASDSYVVFLHVTPFKTRSNWHTRITICLHGKPVSLHVAGEPVLGTGSLSPSTEVCQYPSRVILFADLDTSISVLTI